jgi:hypothetical protein
MPTGFPMHKIQFISAGGRNRIIVEKRFLTKLLNYVKSGNQMTPSKQKIDCAYSLNSTRRNGDALQCVYAIGRMNHHRIGKRSNKV